MAAKHKSTVPLSPILQQLIDLARARAFQNPWAAICEGMELTPTQAMAVMWLGLDGEMPMGSLASLCTITEKSVTGLVDRLEVIGVVERVRSETDRRAVFVGLTKRGLKLHAELLAHAERLLAAGLAIFDEREQKLFREVIRITSAHLLPKKT